MNRYTLGTIGATLWCGFAIVAAIQNLTGVSTPSGLLDQGLLNASLAVVVGQAILLFSSFVLLVFGIQALLQDFPSLLLRIARYLAGVGLFPIPMLVLMKYTLVNLPFTGTALSLFVSVMRLFLEVPLAIALGWLPIVLGLFLILKKDAMDIGNLPLVTGIFLILSLLFFLMPIGTALLTLLFLRLRKKPVAPLTAPTSGAGG